MSNPIDDLIANISQLCVSSENDGSFLSILKVNLTQNVTVIENIIESAIENTIENTLESTENSPLNYTNISRRITLLRYQADNIPTFDGNTKLLQRFICACENFLKNFQNSTNLEDAINNALIDTI